MFSVFLSVSVVLSFQRTVGRNLNGKQKHCMTKPHAFLLLHAYFFYTIAQLSEED